jgi:hypothetical protein
MISDRSAIKTLEAVGFLDRWPATGSAYRPIEHGLRRKPVGFTFGREYMPALLAANRRAAVRRGADRGAGGYQTPGTSISAPQFDGGSTPNSAFR